MGEMTRVLVDDSQGRRAHDDTSGDDDLARIPHPARERLRAGRPHRLVRQHVAVGFEVRAAAGGVHHDRATLGPHRIERGDVPPGQIPRAGSVAGVCVQRAAAGLPDRRGHGMAAPLEQPDRRAFGIPE